MSLSANDMNASAVTLLINEESIKLDDNSTTRHPIASISTTTPPNDGKIGETDDESANYTVNKPGIETGDESATYPISKVEIEANDRSETYALTKSEMEQILKEQTEETRLHLVDIVEDPEMDQGGRSFAETVAQIVEWWQAYAEEQNPTSHQIDFGVGSPMSLLMVLALIPEQYQSFICIEDKCRSPFGNGENLSWLHEQNMDVLVGLSIDPVRQSICFGQGLASMVRDDVDEGWRAFTGRSWLEDQMHLWSKDELEPDLYRFPLGTEKIVFFFNPTEIHWTVVEVELDDDVWTYTLYNSLFQGERGPTWTACREQFPLLEQLICRASGFPEPETRQIVAAPSAQQENSYDCGPIAIYNAMELLEGRRPGTEVDTEELRLRYLMLILDALYLLDQDLETPAFRARMREVCLEYPT
ncbi:MAG: hypothetical protein ALECFALPRED_006376 [Alectoria fallacina]|uniref:Ubiquitin-like protease family profile domain-containing protein n=1 Tax=Alectoria fallacina TaxID=1903189 RepID=A0A8H3G390_9LECA|nr:MAG: hypothetical protein ALECFALPRED_006376 [Alectoria fallacina]